MNSPTVILCTTNPYIGSRNRFYPSPDRRKYYRVHDDFPSLWQAKDAIFSLVCELYEIPIYFRHYNLVCAWLKRKGICYYYNKSSFGFEYDSRFYRLESYDGYLLSGYNPDFLCYD